MATTRRSFIASTVGATSAVVAPLAHAADDGHDHHALPSDPALRVKSLESLLVEKGMLIRPRVGAVVDAYEHNIGPRNGARVIARAWSDAGYKQRLLMNANATIAELGYGGAQGEHMIAVENTPKVHNLVVCTLCSCYSLTGPRSSTGLVQVCPL
jgi:nitrile hydratase subunit alpha